MQHAAMNIASASRQECYDICDLVRIGHATERNLRENLLLNFSKNAFAYRSQVPGIDRLLTPAKRSAPPGSVRSLHSVEAT